MIEIPLNAVDHTPARQYCAFQFYLPLKPEVSPLQAFATLQEGLHRAFVQLPWLSGRIWLQSPNSSGFRPGQLAIRHELVATDGPLPSQIQFNELDSAATFDELREAAFPTNTFLDDSLRWAGFRPDVNSGPEVFMAQANFIPGGCILAAGPHHLASDGAAAITIISLWAEHCRGLQSMPLLPVVPPPLESYDRGLLERMWDEHAQRKSVESVDPGNWRLLGRPSPPGLVSEVISSSEESPTLPGRAMKSAIFYVSAAKLVALHQDCAHAGPGITATDALVALIWRSNLKARQAIALQATTATGGISDPESWAGLGVMVDGRAYFKSEWLPPNYLGNLTCVNLVALPLKLLASPELSLGAIAGNIREGANLITTESMMDAYTLSRSVPDYNGLAYADAPLDGTGLLVSPLLGLPTNSINFGEGVFGNEGSPEAMRAPMDWLNKTTRVCVILPKFSGGGVELMLNMFEEEMEMLRQDREFIKYAMFLVD